MSAERAEEPVLGFALGTNLPDLTRLHAECERKLADAQREGERLKEWIRLHGERCEPDTLRLIDERDQAEQRAAALEDVIRDLFHATAQHHCKVCREAMKRHAELIRSCEITRAAPRPAYRRKKPA